jgi:predicted dehydrogenase
MTLRFAVIGLGRMGFRTIQAGRDAGLELAAVLDSAPMPWGLEQDPALAPLVVRDFDRLVAAAPNIVAVSTTADSHAALFRLIAKAGVKKVLMEKPVACSVADGLDMQRIAADQNMQVLVNHNHRCWSVLQTIRAFGRDSRFGSLRSFIITQGAGGLGNLGTHYFDLANWMFDATPISVSAIGTQPEAANPRGAQFQDIGGAVLAEYPGQRRLMLEIGDDVGVIGGYEFRFERGRVVMPHTSQPPQVYVRTVEAQNAPKHFYGSALQEIPWQGFVAGDVVKHTKEVFQDLVAGRQDCGASLKDATDALEVMIGARLSIETGTTATLPLTAAQRSKAYLLA